MTLEEREGRIQEVLMDCVMHWRIRNRIPRERVLQMRAELEQHLREATEDGKPVEEVVGPDTHAFAEEWGESEEPDSLGDSGDLVLFTLASTTTGAAMLLLAAHLWYRTPEIPFNLRKSAKIFLTVKALLTSWLMLGELGRRYGGQLEERKPLPTWARWVERQPLWKRLVVGNAADTLLAGILLGLNLALKGGSRSAFSEWSWRSTTALGTLGALLLWRIRDPITPEELGLEEEDVSR